MFSSLFYKYNFLKISRVALTKVLECPFYQMTVKINTYFVDFITSLLYKDSKQYNLQYISK